MIDYGKQTLHGDDIKSVIKVLNSRFLTSGPLIDKFEKDLGNFFGSKYVTVLNNGTSALNILAKTLNWNENDIVVTSPITFLATASCVYQTKANVAFVDICPKNYTLDPNKLEVLLKRFKRKIKAVIAVDYAGNPCDWKALRYLSNKYGFTLINDACHSMGSKYHQDSKYAIKYSDFVTSSFHPVKAITTGEGGSIMTNRKFFDNKFKLIRNHSMIKNQKRHWEYKVYEPGSNYRITDFQCALGISQLKKLNTFIKFRRIIAKRYNNYLKNDDRFVIPNQDPEKYHAYHLYPLRIKFDKLKVSKDKFLNQFLKKKIKLQVHYIPLHFQPFYKKKAIYEKKELKIAEKFYEQQVSLPVFPNLKIREQRYIIKNLLLLK
jgi:UDP-4-amino-4,6-dideoxy-L-N-acetyl-beta-L-altrosamine transaminase